MAIIQFTPNLQRHIDVDTCFIMGDNVSSILQNLFLEMPQLRGYVLEDSGCLREHVAIFVDGEIIKDKIALSDEVSEDADVFIAQALSGG